MALTFPFDDAPKAGTTREVSPGIRWLRMPMPGALDHINLYLIEDVDGWYIVDCGVDDDIVRQHWLTIFENELADKPVKGVIATHNHPDHIGQAFWLVDHCKVPFYISRGEYLQACMDFQASQPQMLWHFSQYIKSAGLIVSDLKETQTRFEAFRPVIKMPPFYTRLQEGNELIINDRVWRVIIGRGHSPEHACLYCDALGVLISGDQVLPNITPNISVWPTEPEDNPLGDYLESLPRFKQLPKSTFVLPAHRLPFYGLAERSRQLIQHHEVKLDELELACKTPKTVIQLIKVIFSRYIDDEFQFTMAFGETLAHVNYLLVTERIEVSEIRDGVKYFSSVTHRETESPIDQEEGMAW